MDQWRTEGRSAVWLHLPLSLCALVPVAAEAGFQLHHGRGEEVVMNRWLLEHKSNKLPHYASHQVGVCGEHQYIREEWRGRGDCMCSCLFCWLPPGVVYREDTGEILVTQDKFKVCCICAYK